MSSIKQAVVNYISMVQPELEKMAEEKETFLAALNSKLLASVKMGSLSKEEATSIYKQAKLNPSNVLAFLDVPSFQRSFGGVSKTASINEEKDPLYKFCFES